MLKSWDEFIERSHKCFIPLDNRDLNEDLQGSGSMFLNLSEIVHCILGLDRILSGLGTQQTDRLLIQPQTLRSLQDIDRKFHKVKHAFDFLSPN